jgi:hypothetical protein
MVSGPKVFSLPAGGIAVLRNLLLCRRFRSLVPGTVSPRLRRMERLLPHAALRRVSPAAGSLDFWRSLSAAPLREQNAIQSTQAKESGSFYLLSLFSVCVDLLHRACHHSSVFINMCALW